MNAQPDSRFPGWLVRWFDNHAVDETVAPEDRRRIDWRRCVPFIGLHLACLGVFWTGWSWAALGVCFALYVARMFAITGFYHRYFSHRSFKTSRWLQGLMAVVGATAAQRDPMWWASHHFHHHANSDDAEDPHSPARLGFWMSHVGWFMTPGGFLTRKSYVADWAKFPELRWLNRFDLAPPVALGFLMFGLGKGLEIWVPESGTTGWQMLVWGFFVSTIACYHMTFSINSLAHQFGTRRFETDDDSRNNFWLALLTFGEGWHNNHHHYPGSARQGFYWWEIDLTYYALVLLERVGLVWDLRPAPETALRSRLVAEEAA